MTRRVALVTGGARGVGRAVSLRMAQDVDVVVVNYFRSPKAARQTVADIQALGVEAVAVRASVARQDQRERMFQEVADRFGRLDVLVNSAADGALLPAPQVREEHLDRAFATNVKGALGCALAASRLMTDGEGAIVNISTLGGGELVMANYLACAPAKAGLEALTRYLAVELSPRGIRVNTAAAGMLESTVADQFPDAARMQETVRLATPLGRLGKPSELADVVAFLASPQASWITGQTVLADGGLATGAAMLSAVPREIRQTEPRAGAASAPAPARAKTPGQGRAHADDVVIVGMGLAVPGASSPEEFDDLLRRGEPRLIEIPPDRWTNATFWTTDGRAEDKTYSAHSGFVTDLRPHPALLREWDGATDPVGPGPRDLEFTMTWLRHSVLQALEGVTVRDDDRCSFVVGYTADGSQHLEEATVRAAVESRLSRARHEGRISEETLRAVHAALADRYRHVTDEPLEVLPHRIVSRAVRDLLPSEPDTFIVDTACSSSLYSIDLGLLGLLQGRHDVALCGGAFAVGPRGSVLFSKLNGLSRSGRVRSLDESADGVLFSDGAGVVVLKRRSRAESDGDPILATVLSFGASSDGKGKAIYAPSSRGQAIAVQRAYAGAGDEPLGPPQWVVAHATGTPAGDLAETTTLAESFPEDELLVTSNKSVVGHTGWAAGVASVIQAVEAMRTGIIPGQAEFTRRSTTPGGGADSIVVPSAPVAWPAPPGARTVAVSGFGFGGTNAHLLLGDAPLSGAPILTKDPTDEDQLVVVAVGTHLPGQPDDVAAQLTGETASFGTQYPIPPFTSVRMPPGTLRAIDRSQLMVLQCARRVLDALSPVWEQVRDTTGVVVGHSGATRNAMLYATRCYADDLEAAVERQGAEAREAVREVIEQVHSECPPSSEDTFPGMMPNVIAARVANYFDLHGPNMTVDTGFTSSVTALDVAGRYLRAGRLDLALVGGIHGNTTAELASMLSGVVDAADLAEGAFMVALTTMSFARRHGLPIQATLDLAPSDEPGPGSVVPCGTARGGRAECFVGAEGMRALVEVLLRPPATRRARVVCSGDGQMPTLSFEVSSPEQAHASDDSQAEPVMRPLQPDAAPPVVEDVVRRWEVRMQPAVAAPRAVEPWPAGCVVLTDDPALLLEAEPPTSSTVLHVGTERAGTAGAIHLPQPDPESVAAALADRPVTAVRVLTTVPPEAGAAGPGLLALHDALFLVLQRAARRHRQDGTTVDVAVLLLGGQTQRPHGVAGLFAGLLKVARLEGVAPGAVVVATDETDVPGALTSCCAERGARHTSPLVVREGDHRLVQAITPAPLPVDPAPRLGRDDLVVAVGGGRGITAELLVGLAEQAGPRIVVLGSNRLDQHPDSLLRAAEGDLALARREFIARRRAEDPSARVADINRQFERALQARAVVQNMARLRELSGQDRVHYMTCDVTSADQVAAVLDRIHEEHGDIALLIHAAGLNRSAPLADKSFEEFRRIRDLKVRGHDHLSQALTGREPRLWINFGSLLGLVGQVGEADYASANDYLGMAALSRSRPGAVETTLGWTLWGDTGLGADELTKAYFDKAGTYSSMTSAEGVRHFLREIGQAAPHPYTVHLGDAEERAVRSLVPGFLPTESSSFYLGREVERTPAKVVHERTFSLRTDSYLDGHLVDGTATLPGAFVAEIAVEAARSLRPDLVVTAVRDLRFERFLKVDERERTKRICAAAVGEGPEGADVLVQVLEDVIAPDGRVLVRDREHFRAVVECRLRPRPPGRWHGWDETAAREVADPYHAPGSPVLLSGEFRSTTRTRVLPEGGRSRYAVPVPPGHPVYSRFQVPVLALDGLLRTGVLDIVDDSLVPVCAPLTIGRLEIFEALNDCDLGERGGELYAERTHGLSEDAAPGTRFVLTDRGGQVVLQVLDLTWIRLGFIDTTTGRFVEGRATAVATGANA